MMDVRVKEYKQHKQFEHEARKLAKKGWHVTTVAERPQRAGFLRIMSLGLGSLVWKRRAKLLVTYEKADEVDDR